MDEEIYKRDKSGSGKDNRFTLNGNEDNYARKFSGKACKEEKRNSMTCMEENSTRRNCHASKLKNESSRNEALRKKLRTKKADIKETAEDIEKTRKLRKQGRKKAYKEAAVSAGIHQKISEENEDGNAGVEAVNRGTELAENGIYFSKAKDGKSNKLHGRKTGKNEEEAINELKKNLMKKEIQRQAFKAQAAENANAFGNLTKRFYDKAEDMAGKIAEAVKELIEEHPVGIVTAIIILIVVLVLSGSVSSCSMMASGGNNVIVGTSFTAQDSALTAVENDYKGLESGLQSRVENIESEYPDYDEYKYSLSEINHDPFELAALLTVLEEDYTEEEAKEKLQAIFDKQYELTTEEVVETRTRIETRTGTHTVTEPDGSTSSEDYTYEVEVQYDYYILNVTLKNKSIQEAVNALNLTEDQLKRYNVILEMKGNKPDIFGSSPYINPSGNAEYDNYAVPGEYMTDQQFSNMLREAKKYLGYPYVWGGSSPSTSFDCSGFVSWVINHCGNGWSYGRLTANEWKNATKRVNASDVNPGDLVFFQGTYSTSGASHVGIVVDPANKMMIHCGKPVQYASYDTEYWRKHFYCYGRIQ